MAGAFFRGVAMLTQSQAAAELLAARYEVEWYGVYGALDAIALVLAEDFPPPGSGTAAPTRYDVDSLRALKSQLSALVEGWERRG